MITIKNKNKNIKFDDLDPRSNDKIKGQIFNFAINPE